MLASDVASTIQRFPVDSEQQKSGPCEDYSITIHATKPPTGTFRYSGPDGGGYEYALTHRQIANAMVVVDNSVRGYEKPSSN